MKMHMQLVLAVLGLLIVSSISAATLARQSGAVGVITYDPIPHAETQTTPVSVPYAWLRTNYPDVADDYEAYETSAKTTAANGRKVWECYVVGLDPTDASKDFRITSFPMKDDGTPDLANMTFAPPQSEWNVPAATPKQYGAATLEGPWSEVPEGGDSTMKFFKIVVELP